MIGGENAGTTSLDVVRSALVTRLRARRSDFADAIFAHVRGVSPLAGDAGADEDDVEYEAGLRAGVAAAIDYSFRSSTRGAGSSGSIPAAVAEQARRAARNGVSLDSVLLRCATGRALLADLVMREARELPNEALRNVLATQASSLDRLMAAIATEYRGELERVQRSPEQRRAELVRELLKDALVDTSEFDYQFDAWHLGLIATGVAASKTVGGLAARLGCELLSVSRGDVTAWAWLGSRRRLAIAEVEAMASMKLAGDTSLAMGEPCEGVDGWRLTHRQAQEAMLVSMHKSQCLTRYSDVLLLAAGLRNDTLAKSLQAIYLSPLNTDPTGGVALRQTLSAYFAADHNVKAAAAALGVDRGTVRKRLQTIERRLGRSPHTCQAELQVALGLEGLHKASDGVAERPPALCVV